MAIITHRPKGTQDVVPNQIYKWHFVEKTTKSIAELYGFKEIRIPTFEDTGLFIRSVGDTTDVVQKEMYTVSATGDSTFTLRPEGTAGTMRAIIENGILNEGFPQKVFYMLSCFRHEKPQAGRLREFHQFGCEMVGSENPRADAEVIALARNLIDELGIRNVELNINSIGCPKCRAEYHKALKEYFEARKDELCDTCKTRLEKNPMRILDCKSSVCQDIAKDAPIILDYLCDDCREHFEQVKAILGSMGIAYKINPKIVRGLDYYTRTVFEFISTDIGAQGTVCAGGRYDGLIEELGGKATPALGFAMGLERIILTMESQGISFGEPNTCCIYFATMGDKAVNKAIELTSLCRKEFISAEYDLIGRGLKAQMKYANKIGAKYTIVLGDDEIESGNAKIKNMQSGEETPIQLNNKFIEQFDSVLAADIQLNSEEH
ncbi:MAG: histidine--tRNA ligase [Oscillospiraceae bacterium]